MRRFLLVVAILALIVILATCDKPISTNHIKTVPPDLYDMHGFGVTAKLLRSR